MIGDKLIFLEEHKEKAKRILEKFNFEKGKKIIISIDGECGAGKSEVAYILRTLLMNRKALRSVIYCLDDYKNRPNDYGIDKVRIDEIDYTIEKIFSDIPSINIEIYDKFLNSKCHLYYNNKDVDVIIIEGTFSLSVKKSKYRVLLKGTYKDTEDFRIKRNKNEPTPALEKEHIELENLKNKIKPNLII